MATGLRWLKYRLALYTFFGIPFVPAGLHHATLGLSGIKKDRIDVFSQLTPVMQSLAAMPATALRSRGDVVATGRFRWCGLRPPLEALLTVSVPSVDSLFM